MPRSTHAKLTPDEVVALLKRTSLPTLVVEGADDIVVYRTFERALADIGVSVLPVGGRNNVLEVFLRKNEIKNTKVSFIADRDVWVTIGIPAKYTHNALTFTMGYSIENDVFVDGGLLGLLTNHEQNVFARELETFSYWYALALSRFVAGGGAPISLHPTHVLESGQYAALTALLPGERYPQALLDRISRDYTLELRGKALLGLLLRRTNAKGRGTNHTATGLMETVAIRPGALLQRLVDSVRASMA